MSGQLVHHETTNGFYQISISKTEENIVHKSNQSLQNFQNLQESVRSSNRFNPFSHPPVSNRSEQILGVRNLANLLGQTVMLCKDMGSIENSMKHVDATMLNNSNLYTNNSEKTRESDKVADRSNMELNLNLHDGIGIVKKSVKGVKLVGMEGGTLRRPSLQV